MVMTTKSIFALALLAFTLPAVADTVTVSNRSHYSINITNQNSGGGNYVIFQGQSRTLEGDSIALNWLKIKPIIPLAEPISTFQFPVDMNTADIKVNTEVTILGDIFSPQIKTVTTVVKPSAEVISQTYTLNNWGQLQSSEAAWQPQP